VLDEVERGAPVEVAFDGGDPLLDEPVHGPAQALDPGRQEAGLHRRPQARVRGAVDKQHRAGEQALHLGHPPSIGAAAQRLPHDPAARPLRREPRIFQRGLHAVEGREDPGAAEELAGPVDGAAGAQRVVMRIRVALEDPGARRRFNLFSPQHRARRSSQPRSYRAAFGRSPPRRVGRDGAGAALSLVHGTPPRPLQPHPAFAFA
jgi:hypothetical protein